MTKIYSFPKNSIAKSIQEDLANAVNEISDQTREGNSIHLEHPREDDHGDYATNVAMTLTKELGKPPREIAADIVTSNYIKQSTHYTISIEGPGFINFKINPKTLAKEVDKIKENYGFSDYGKDKTVMVEFGQPNTHKAFHVGHLKSAISGLAMVGLHRSNGYKVIEANFYGDVGMQVAKSIWGFLDKGKPQEFDGWNEHERMKYIDNCYAHGAKMFKEDKKIEAEIREINKKVYSKEDKDINKVYEQTREWSLDHLNSVFAELGVNYDVQYPESTTADLGLKVVEENIGKIFQESEGAIIFKGEDVGLNTWVFKSGDGIPTYSAKDLGLAIRKFSEYDLDLAIVTTSVEQADYFKAIIYVLNQIKPETEGKYKHIPFGWMLRNNKKTSSRMGGSVKGMDIIQEAKDEADALISENKDYSEIERKEIAHAVALAGLKFLILSHEFHKNINYDPESFISLTGFSGPYLLYSYARAKSVIRKAGDFSGFDNIELKTEEEIKLARKIAKFPDIILASGLNIAPHMLCNYLYELAQLFNGFYTNCSILEAETEEIKNSRLKLTESFSIVMKNGLKTLGIETVEKM